MNHKSKNKNYSVKWSHVLKVWLYLIKNDKADLFTTRSIAHDICISESAVKNARYVLRRDFGAIISQRVIEKQAEDQYRCLGSVISLSAFLNMKD